MKRIFIILIIMFFGLVLKAQVMNAKDSLKNDISEYVILLNDNLKDIEKTNNIDSLKNYTTEINTSIDQFLLKIKKIYNINQKNRKGSAYFGIATTLNHIRPNSGAGFQAMGVNKLLRQTDNDRYYKRLAQINKAAKKLKQNNNPQKIKKLKTKLIKAITNLNKIQLK